MSNAGCISECDSRASWSRRAALWLVCLLTGLAAPAAHAHSRSATELETRLFAPCCWIQTLDVHESELADKLRAEIAQRLAAGEAALHIEDDLVARYGERLRAVPRDSDPRADIPLIVGVALGLALLALAGFALRWQRAQRTEAQSEESADAAAQYDHKLDAALRHNHSEEPPPLSAA